MKQTISKDHFRFMFNQVRPNNFSYEAQGILFDFFEQLEQDTGEEMELDVIAICCDFTESSVEQIIRDYSIDCDEVEDDELDAHVLEYLNEQTIVCGQTDDSIVFQQF